MDKDILIKLVSERKTQREIAEELGVSHTTVRYWLSKHNLTTDPIRGSWDDNLFIEKLKTAKSINHLLETMGLNTSSTNYKKVKDSATRLGVELPDRPTPKVLTKLEIDKIFSKGAPGRNRRLKSIMINDLNIEDKCALCGQLPEWNGKPLTLQLDHIDGDRFNNSLDNLRILCPNCHTQTETFCVNK